MCSLHLQNSLIFIMCVHMCIAMKLNIYLRRLHDAFQEVCISLSYCTCYTTFLCGRCVLRNVHVDSFDFLFVCLYKLSVYIIMMNCYLDTNELLHVLFLCSMYLSCSLSLTCQGSQCGDCHRPTCWVDIPPLPQLSCLEQSVLLWILSRWVWINKLLVFMCLLWMRGHP